MIIHVDHMSQEEVNRINIQRTYDMLGIDPDKVDALIAAHEAEAAAKKKAADEVWRTRAVNAIDKLKKIRQDIVDGKTDVKVGSLICIDGFVFTV